MNDADLSGCLLRLKKGDMDAFEELYNDLKTPIFTVILRTGCDQSLAEDVMQELFVKLFQSPPEPTPQKPRAYLFKCARNLAIDNLRKQPCYADIDDLDSFVCPREESRDAAIDIELALSRLPLLERQIVSLHINAGLTFREIAEVTGRPLGTVLWRYRRALDMLRKIMTGGQI